MTKRLLEWTACKECFEHETCRPDGICYRCDQELHHKDRTVGRYEAVRIPYPESAPVPNCAGKWKEFNKPTPSQKARDMCHTCPAYEWCLTWGIENDEWGTWGGLSQDERRLVKAGMLTRAGYTLIA